MRCVVSTCGNNIQRNPDITFFTFPTNPSLRATWLGALQEDCKLEEDSAVCSEHFLMKDLMKTNNGKLLLRADAVPVLKVCRVCLKTEGEMYKMEKNTLCELFQGLTGLMLSDELRLPRSVCPECCSWLLECERFKSTSLRSHLVLQQILNRHGCITVESVQSINKFHSPVSLDTTDKQTDQCHSHNEDVIKHEDAQTDRQTDMASSSKVFETIKIDIKVEIDNIMHVGNIKKEYDIDDTDKMTDDNDNTENSVVDNVLDLQETAADLVKVEIEDMNVAGVNKQTDKDDSEHITDGAGKDCSPDNLSLRELTQTKTPQHYNMNDDTRREQGIDGPSIEKMSCQLCPYETTCVKQLKAHEKAHSARKSFKCSQCSYITVYRGNLKYHMARHTNEECTCQVCNKMFGDKIRLQRHMRYHSGVKMFSCDFCIEKFNRKLHLQQHLGAHLSETPYSCDICKQSFIVKAKLKLHMRAHSERKQHICGICFKRFKLSHYLSKHMKTHTGEKPYSCEICSKSFTHKYYLWGHMKTHSGERPYSCDICNKSYTLRANQLRHMKTHSGEKPYSCDFCTKSYTRKVSLLVHMNTHTG